MHQPAPTPSPSAVSDGGQARCEHVEPSGPVQQGTRARTELLPWSSVPSEKLEWIQDWPEIHARIAARPRLLLGLGFDGILSPTVPRPSEATLPEETYRLLSKLGASPRITLAFLSGRSMGDIRTRVRQPNAFYAANHGMEVHGPGLTSSDGLAVSCRSDLVDALAFLARCTKRLRGVYIEDKGLTVTVHWRLANPGEGAALRELLEVIVQSHPRLKIFAGEACWELRARGSWNKGDAIRQILTHLRLTTNDTIYIGEEFTDEDAFVQLSEGLTFSVGSTTSTAAQYRLPQPRDAAQLLFCVLCAINGMRLK